LGWNRYAVAAITLRQLLEAARCPRPQRAAVVPNQLALAAVNAQIVHRTVAGPFMNSARGARSMKR